MIVKLDRGEAFHPELGQPVMRLQPRDMPGNIGLQSGDQLGDLRVGAAGKGDTLPQKIYPGLVGPAIVEVDLGVGLPVADPGKTNPALISALAVAVCNLIKLPMSLALTRAATGVASVSTSLTPTTRI